MAICCLCIFVAPYSIYAREYRRVQIEVDSAYIARTDSGMQLTLLLHLERDTIQRDSLSKFERRNRKEFMQRFQPLLVNGGDTVVFPNIGVYDKKALWHHATMAHRQHPYDSTEYQINAHLRDTSYLYRYTVAYEPWMEGASLVIDSEQAYKYEIRNIPRDESKTIRFTSPTNNRVEHNTIENIEEQMEPIQGISRITFPVNRTEIFPTYKNNEAELEHLISLFDSLTTDSTIHINSVSLHGYASPEGSYRNNVRLAKGRTASIMEFIADRYDLPDSIIHTRYTAENWSGFRDSIRLRQMGSKVRHHLLRLMGSYGDPDKRLDAMRIAYPTLMRNMERDIFPDLRITTYTIDYTRTHTIVHTEVQEQTYVDTIIAPHQPDHLQTTPRRRPLFAIKTNLLYDAALLTPNIEIEVPIGYHPWSIMAEWWTPWYVWGEGKMQTHAYSFMLAGLELRYWFRDRQSDWCQPVMQGHFLGLYGAGGFYDIQPWRKDKEGWQGEYTSIGLTYGYVLPVAAHWSFEFSVSAGYVGGPQRVYKSMFDNEHLIWQRDQHFWMIAPTKLKVSISYMITAKEKQKKTH